MPGVLPKDGIDAAIVSQIADINLQSSIIAGADGHCLLHCICPLYPQKQTSWSAIAISRFRCIVVWLGF